MKRGDKAKIIKRDNGTDFLIGNTVTVDTWVESISMYRCILFGVPWHFTETELELLTPNT